MKESARMESVASMETPKITQEKEQTIYPIIPKTQKYSNAGSFFLKSYISPEETRRQSSDISKSKEEYWLNMILESQQYSQPKPRISWWESHSTIRKLRAYPREFLSFGTAIFFFGTLFLIIAGLILDRIIIAPDFGTSSLILFLFLWLMTQVSKRKGLKHE